jgi:hypothetical protein
MTTNKENPMSITTGTMRETIARFAALQGAVVNLTRITDRRNKSEYAWACNGCKDSSGLGEPSLRIVRQGANTHAGNCRALPPIR